MGKIVKLNISNIPKAPFASQVHNLFLDKLLDPQQWCRNLNCKGKTAHKFDYMKDDIITLIYECKKIIEE